MTTGKTIALTRQTFFGKVMSLLFNMLSRLVIAFLGFIHIKLRSWHPVPSLHANRWGKNGNSDRLYLGAGAPKSLQMVTAAMKLNDIYSLVKNYDQLIDSILKSRDITLPTKVHLVKAMVFPVVMYGS